MPLLTYSYPDFTPQTVIQSAKVNAKYNDIKTLLNVTGLDDVNVQDNGLTRGTKLKTGTANFVVVNDASGHMTEEAALSPTRGGTGVSATITAADAGKVFQVDNTGAVVLATPPESPGSRLYIYNRFS